ncbi:MAG: hypothetical protein KUG77_10280 [Nannocystaceae bacterium]|nr:hypothetical protein [Nannocystaceae bacterium]
MNERDERWQARQDALALEEPVDANPAFDDRDEPQWRDELDFYASLAKHATQGAAPTSNDDELIRAALVASPGAASPSVVPRFAVVASVVALAAAALLWLAWPQQTPLRGVERGWASEAQDVLETISRQLEQAETSQEKSKAARDGVRLSPPKPKAEPEAEHASSSGGEGEPEGVVREAPTRRAQSRPRADAATLVVTARTARGDGRLSDAERSYGELLRRFPKSAEARAGRVALAQIKLGRGKAKAALRLFSAAAGGGGPLAEEAAWGRIQALDRLGRKNGLRKAVESFVRDYPTSVYRARAQGRVDL